MQIVSLGIACQRFVLVIIIPVLLVRVAAVKRHILSNKLSIETSLTFDISCVDPLTVMAESDMINAVEQPLDLLTKAGYLTWAALTIVTLEAILIFSSLVTKACINRLYEGLMVQLADTKHVIRLYFVLN